MKARSVLICVVSVIVVALPRAVPAMDAAGKRPTTYDPSTAGPAPYPPAVQYRVHRVGKIRFSISNQGILGSQSGGEREFCFNRWATSLEFPKRSYVNYLYQGALWVGAVVGNDTLVSVGSEGWATEYEMFPPPSPEGDLVERTTRDILKPEEGSSCPATYFSADAVSEQDFVAVYSDTVRDTTSYFFDSFDHRYHVPLGLEITQKSYSWSYDYADDFIIVEWLIKNIGASALSGVRVGLMVDADIGYVTTSGAYTDDICGYLRTAPSLVGLPEGDTMNLAWAADNDGDPLGLTFRDNSSATGVLGVRLLGTPTGAGPASFNWWVSNSTPQRDWGPNHYLSNVYYPAGNLGTPRGDMAKYQMLGNGEFDYDQIESALDHSAEGWLPPSSSAATDIADGWDLRMLFGAEQLDLAPGASAPFAVALVAGPGFHRDPENFFSYWDPYHPDQFKARLDFSGLIRNARWAGWVYDNPGRDTDGNGYRGKFVVDGDDTLYHTGDGVPDYRGPEAPPPPELHFRTSPGRVEVRWNGRRAELTRDAFTHFRDFEGYRVYFGRSPATADLALVAQRDVIDFVRWEYEPIGKRWRIEQPAFTRDSLNSLYDSLSQAQRGFPFDPDSFVDTSLSSALWEVTADTADPVVLDTHYYAFAPVDLNHQVDDRSLYSADSAGANIVQVIRKPYPFATPDDTMWRDDGTPFFPYWEYEYAIDGLYPGEPVYIAVTCYDFGDPAAGVGPTETDPLANVQEVWPVAAGSTVDSLHPAPGVYPNPYRVMDDYVAQGWERLNPAVPDPEYSRQMTFYNLPDTCTISIWTLDGDLVRELRHREAPDSPQAGFAIWDLINRNNDIITHGLYIYSIESSSGTFVGKLAIIR